VSPIQILQGSSGYFPEVLLVTEQKDWLTREDIKPKVCQITLAFSYYLPSLDPQILYKKKKKSLEFGKR
jgi:hypothetical protein